MRVLVLALLCALAIPASADPNAKAAAHYKQGKVFLDAKQYDQAIVEFEAAYAIDKLASHLFNIAKAYDAKSDYDKAIDYYQKYLDAEPKSARAAEVRGYIAVATQARADALAKKKAEEDAARLAAENKRLEEDQAKKVGLATGHVKQADAFAKAGAWVDAGSEHRAAYTIDGDAAHLLAAAEAYARAPDLGKTRDAYRDYLEKVPTGSESDAVRGKLAETTRAIEKAEDEARQRKAREAAEQAESDRRSREGRPFIVVGERHKSFKRGWIVVGGAMIMTGLLADLKAPNGDNGKLDASDFTGPLLYTLGSIAVLRGVF